MSALSESLVLNHTFDAVGHAYSILKEIIFCTTKALIVAGSVAFRTAMMAFDALKGSLVKEPSCSTFINALVISEKRVFRGILARGASGSCTCTRSTNLIAR